MGLLHVLNLQTLKKIFKTCQNRDTQLDDSFFIVNNRKKCMTLRKADNLQKNNI